MASRKSTNQKSKLASWLRTADDKKSDLKQIWNTLNFEAYRYNLQNKIVQNCTNVLLLALLEKSIENIFSFTTRMDQLFK